MNYELFNKVDALLDLAVQNGRLTDSEADEVARILERDLV